MAGRARRGENRRMEIPHGPQLVNFADDLKQLQGDIPVEKSPDSDLYLDNMSQQITTLFLQYHISF